MSESPRDRRFTRSYSPSRSRSPRGGGGDRRVGERSTVYVGGLAQETDERALKDYFERYGPIVGIKVVYDIETGRPKGFGFVTFEDGRDAEDAAHECNGKTLDGRTIKCNIAKYAPPSHRPGFPAPTRGRGRGGGRGPPRPMRGYPDDRYDDRYQGYESDASPPRSERSRSFSPAPVAHRKRARIASPPPEGSPVPGSRRKRSARKGGAASETSGSSKSHSSGSESSDSEDSKAARKVAKAGPLAPPPTAVFKKELQSARRREAELYARIANLESELAQSRGKSDSQVEELRAVLQARDQTISQLKKCVSSLIDSCRGLTEARANVSQAQDALKVQEEEVAAMSFEAESFVQKVDKASRTAAREARRAERERERGERERAAQDGTAEELQAAPDAAPPPTNNHQEAPPAEGGWALGDEAMVEAEGEDAAAKFKPGIKFKLTA